MRSGCVGPPSLRERVIQVREGGGGSEKLSRCLTLLPLIVQGLAHMLGAGIFVITPTIVQSVAGPATCISYLLSGLAAGLSVLCYSDLASRYTCTGSAYVYSYFSLGELASAVVGTFLVGELIIQPPLLTLGISDNMDAFLLNGTLRAWAEETLPPWTLHTDLLAIGVMVIFVVVNLVGIKGVASLNTAILVVSTLSLATFIVTALIYGSSDNLHAVVNPADGRTGFAPFGLSGIVSGAGVAFFAFVGLESVVCLGEEAVNPQRDLPRATLISFLAVLVIYALTAFSIAYFVPWFTLDGTTGFIGSLQDRGLVVVQYIEIVGLIFTVFSCGMCTLTTTVRVVYSMAEDGLLFSWLAWVDPRSQIPVWNVVVCGLVGILTSIIYDFETLSHMISGGTLAVFAVTALAVIILSYETADKPSPSERTPLSASSRPTHHTFAIVLCLFLASAGSLCGLSALATQTYAVIAVETLLGSLAFLCLLFIWVRFEKKAGEKQLAFRSPAKPFLQGLSITLNLLLLFHLEVRALLQLGLYALIGLVTYFCYGIFNSRLTREKQHKLLSTELLGTTSTISSSSSSVIQNKQAGPAT